MQRALSSALLAGVIACAPLWAGAGATANQRRLHVEQQQDALNLQLRQSARARRHDLSPSDARRLEQLDLQQRLDRQQLELQQIQRERALSRNSSIVPPDVLDRRIDAQRDAFAQERALQLQRFELERQRASSAIERRPLQPPLGAPQPGLQ